jgi:hypothetical protein
MKRMSPIDVAIHWWKDDLGIITPDMFVIETPKPVTYGDIVLGPDLMIMLKEKFGIDPYDAQDVAHTAIDSAWLLNVCLLAWTRNRERRGLLEHKEQNDCDNRAYSFWQYVCELWAIHDIYGQAPAMGIVKHLNPGHVLNHVLTERGIICVDVQRGEVPQHPDTYKVAI